MVEVVLHHRTAPFPSVNPSSASCFGDGCRGVGVVAHPPTQCSRRVIVKVVVGVVVSCRSSGLPVDCRAFVVLPSHRNLPFSFKLPCIRVAAHHLPPAQCVAVSVPSIQFATQSLHPYRSTPAGPPPSQPRSGCCCEEREDQGKKNQDITGETENNKHGQKKRKAGVQKAK